MFSLAAAHSVLLPALGVQLLSAGKLSVESSVYVTPQELQRPGLLSIPARCALPVTKTTNSGARRAGVRWGGESPRAEDMEAGALAQNGIFHSSLEAGAQDQRTP